MLNEQQLEELTITGSKQVRRPDVVAFVNGLALAVVELKSPANEQIGRDEIAF
nr:type I restriction endonuclease [Roseateles sp.]